MVTKNFHQISVFLSIVVLFLCTGGCGETRRLVQLNPMAIPELRGNIRSDKPIYEIGEPILVRYWLTNVSAKLIREELTDGSKGDVPFEKYSFNAVLSDQSGHGDTKNEHLKLKTPGVPIQGTLILEPGDKKVFVENVFKAQVPGPYILSFELVWRNGKNVTFNSITIGVKSKKDLEPQISPPLQKALEELRSSDIEIRKQARNTIKHLGKEAAPGLCDLLKSDKEDMRAEAIELLIQLKDEATPTLVKMADHPDREIRRGIIEIFAELGGFKASIVLRGRLLKDPDLTIRQAALDTLAESFANEIVIPLMISALADQERQIRYSALKTLRSRVTKIDISFPVDGSQPERDRELNRLKEWWLEKNPKAFEEAEFTEGFQE